ncbi:MAG: 50S ribosomal protein L25 [Candidatus Promineofilum sp.]|nr:50S ribosomal protein L25 [Promineifilum sp.]
MSERIVIEAEPREIIGKQTSRLRREGWIPGVIYGRETPQTVQMEQKALRRALRVVGTAHLADLSVGGATHTVLVREIQQHATRGDIVHVDFMEVDMKSKLRSSAAIVGTGEAPPEADGLGVATILLREVEIECLPEDLVAEIEFDLGLIATPEDVVYVRDLIAPKGVEILVDPDTVVASFEYTTIEETEEGEGLLEGEESGDAVEVISRGKKEEENF